jgi:uncharacterized protein (DUF983 family)
VRWECGPGPRAKCHNGWRAQLAYFEPMIGQRTNLAHRPRDLVRAMLRGFSQRCPACGEGLLFGRYLKVADTCAKCAEALHHHRTDDAPPYFTIAIVGHVIIAGVLALEKGLAPPTWVHMTIWLPLTLAASLWLLPRVKGALVGLQWALYMHGFDQSQGSQGSGPL